MGLSLAWPLLSHFLGLAPSTFTTVYKYLQLWNRQHGQMTARNVLPYWVWRCPDYCLAKRKHTPTFAGQAGATPNAGSWILFPQKHTSQLEKMDDGSFFLQYVGWNMRLNLQKLRKGWSNFGMWCLDSVGFVNGYSTWSGWGGSEAHLWRFGCGVEVISTFFGLPSLLVKTQISEV